MLGPIGANLQNIQKVSAGQKPAEAKKSSVNNVTKLRAVSDEGLSLDEAEAYKIEHEAQREREKEEEAALLYSPSDYQTDIDGENRDALTTQDEYHDPPKLWLVKNINKFTPEEAIEIYKDIQAMGPIKVLYDENDDPMISDGTTGILINKKQL